jgi:hypothetical protein
MDEQLERSHGRSMLEAMTGAAAYKPDVFMVPMTIDEEVAGRRVLVLTHATLDKRRICHARKSTLQPRASGVDALAIDAPISRVRIEPHAMRVDAHLEAAALEIRSAIDAGSEINPGRCVWCSESIIPRLECRSFLAPMAWKVAFEVLGASV